VQRSLRAVLDRLIDYAGLFPPAGLGMSEAVANYAAYQAGPDRWALARFIVPASRLDEFETARLGLPSPQRDASRWPLSVLLGPSPEAGWAEVTRFQTRAGAGVTVESVEARVTSPAEVDALRGIAPVGTELYLECRPDAGLPGLLDAILRVGARAKLRTGGIRAEEIPAPETVLGFIAGCADRRLPFKATAGLHHPVGGSYPLTYEAGSACATMFGYLNLVLAAAVLWAGGPADDARAVLAAHDRGLLAATDTALSWGEVTCSTGSITGARREFMMAIGSCSFTEPLSEIATT
jgi:hypothetical protein